MGMVGMFLEKWGFLITSMNCIDVHLYIASIFPVATYDLDTMPMTNKR